MRRIHRGNSSSARQAGVTYDEEYSLRLALAMEEMLIGHYSLDGVHSLSLAIGNIVSKQLGYGWSKYDIGKAIEIIEQLEKDTDDPLRIIRILAGGIAGLCSKVKEFEEMVEEDDDDD